MLARQAGGLQDEKGWLLGEVEATGEEQWPASQVNAAVHEKWFIVGRRRSR